MTTAVIREKLHDFINTADDLQVEAIYSIFEDKLTQKHNHWEDKEFIAELDKRIEDFESGKVKGVSWEEVKKKATDRLNAKR